MIDHPSWLARVLTVEGTTAGTGIAVNDRHVITCAHLPAGPGGELLAAGQTVLVEFPFAGAGAGPFSDRPAPPREAQVIFARLVTHGWADLAVLEFAAPVPGVVPPRLLQRPSSLAGRVVTVRGFPFWGAAQAPDAAMRLSGDSRAGWVQLNPIGSRGWTVDLGFSGGPVWDDEVGAVIGMTVAKSGAHAGDMIPLDHLASLWPNLARHLEPFPETQVSPASRHWMSAAVVMVIVAALVLAATVFIGPYLKGNTEVQDPTGLPVVEASHAGGTSPAAEQTQDFLATVLRLNNVCARVDFAEGMEEAAVPFLDTGQVYSTDEYAFIGDALAAGAYATGSLVIEFTLQTEFDHVVTIYNIRAVVTKAEPLSMHSHLGLETCGGGQVDAMVIPLGAPDPGPFVRDEYGRMTSQKFFDSKMIEVSPTEKPYVLVEVFTNEPLFTLETATAYEFMLEIEYEVGGEVGTQVVDLDGSPFRITTGQACYEAVVGYGGLTGFNEDPTLSHSEHREC